jgi:hypothetical protein
LFFGYAVASIIEPAVGVDAALLHDIVGERSPVPDVVPKVLALLAFGVTPKRSNPIVFV